MSGHIGAEIHGVDLRELDPRDGGRHPRHAPAVEGRVLPRPGPHPGPAPRVRPGVRRARARPPDAAAGVPRLPRDPAARQPGRRRRRRQQDRRPDDREPLAHRRHVRAPSRRWRRSCAASWCRPTAATRSGPTWSRPTSSSRRRCRSSSTASTRCTTTTCRSCGARCRASWPSSSRRGPSARSTRSCGCTPRRARRALFVSPNFTSHIVELSRKEGRHVLEMLFEQLMNPAFTVRFRWEPDSIAFWDNRCHRAPGAHRRAEGDAPVDAAHHRRRRHARGPRRLDLVRAGRRRRPTAETD